MTRAFRILVVDDDEDNACSLGELFELEGHSVTVVHSGDDAIAAYLESEFDMAFMDVMMPGRNGVESFMEIRKLKPDARVFMMTGYSVEQLLQQAVDNGAMGVLTKPVDIDKLLRAVNEAAPAGIVLIADDDPGCGRQIKSLMDDAGYECDLLRNEEDFAREVQALDIVPAPLRGLDEVAAIDELARGLGRDVLALGPDDELLAEDRGHRDGRAADLERRLRVRRRALEGKGLTIARPEGRLEAHRPEILLVILGGHLDALRSHGPALEEVVGEIADVGRDLLDCDRLDPLPRSLAGAEGEKRRAAQDPRPDLSAVHRSSRAGK